MRTKFGSIIIAAAGSIGGTFISKNRGVSSLRISSTHIRSCSPGQSIVRQNWLLIVSSWSALSESDRVLWLHTIIGNKHGFSLYTSINCVLAFAGLPLLTQPPTVLPDNSCPHFSVYINNITEVLELVLFSNLTPNQFLCISITKPLSPGIACTPNNFSVLSITPSSTLFPFNYYSQYINLLNSIGYAGQSLHVNCSTFFGNAGIKSIGSKVIGEVLGACFVNKSRVAKTWIDLFFTSPNRIPYTVAYLEKGICLSIVASSSYSLLRSVDYGQTWVESNPTVGETGGGGIAYCGNGIVLIGSYPHANILRSTDYGQTWVNLGQQFSQSQIFSLIYLEEGICLAGTGSGGLILRSTDYGQTWSNLGQQYAQTSIQCFAYCGNGIVIAGCRNTGLILRSTNYGQTWSNLGQQFSQSQIWSIVYCGNGICLAGTGSGGLILRSTNYGQTWSNIGQQFSQTRITSFAYIGSGVVLAGSGASIGYLLKSLDYGQTWSNLGRIGTSSRIDALAALPDSSCIAGSIESAQSHFVVTNN